MSEKHLWTLSPKWNNCVNRISKVTLTQPKQENSCIPVLFLLLFMPVRFARTKSISMLDYISSVSREGRNFIKLLSFIKFYQASVTGMGLDSFFPLPSVLSSEISEHMQAIVPIHCRWWLGFFSNIFAVCPCSFFQHLAICSN